MPQPEFDPEEHERQVNERYAQLSRYESFDMLVDMALDGVITMEEAKTEWLASEAEAEEWEQAA